MRKEVAKRHEAREPEIAQEPSESQELQADNAQNSTDAAWTKERAMYMVPSSSLILRAPSESSVKNLKNRNGSATTSKNV